MRAADPDNNKKVGASSSSTPPLHAEVRAAVYNKLVPDPRIIDDGAYRKTDAILQAVADALLAAVEQERISSQETEDRQLYGYNYALDAVTRVIGELLGCSPMSSDVSKPKDMRL